MPKYSEIEKKILKALCDALDFCKRSYGYFFVAYHEKGSSTYVKANAPKKGLCSIEIEVGNVKKLYSYDRETDKVEECTEKSQV